MLKPSAPSTLSKPAEHRVRRVFRGHQRGRKSKTQEAAGKKHSKVQHLKKKELPEGKSEGDEDEADIEESGVHPPASPDETSVSVHNVKEPLQWS